MYAHAACARNLYGAVGYIAIAVVVQGETRAVQDKPWAAEDETRAKSATTFPVGCGTPTRV